MNIVLSHVINSGMAAPTVCLIDNRDWGFWKSDPKISASKQDILYITRRASSVSNFYFFYKTEGGRVKGEGWRVKDGGWRMEGEGGRLKDEGGVMYNGEGGLNTILIKKVLDI
jgi:hypothetical protein